MLKGKYNPKDFEDELYKEWEEKGYFKPSMDEKKEPYCIMMPPPNVTGKLHMGHALDDTIQDILIRYKRMRGYDCLWLPGSDHASISTEMKVVQKLKSEGKTKQDIGRERFLEETWDWTHKYGGIIQEQQRKLGCSCDWSRNRFTMDEGLSDAVLEQFVSLYNKGLRYKGTRMVNYCPSCKTTISDAEVEYKEEPSHLWHIRYELVDEPGKYVEVATTRPETMLGATAVAERRPPLFTELTRPVSYSRRPTQGKKTLGVAVFSWRPTKSSEKEIDTESMAAMYSYRLSVGTQKPGGHGS